MRARFDGEDPALDLLEHCRERKVAALLSCAAPDLEAGVRRVESGEFAGLQLRGDPGPSEVLRARRRLGVEPLLGASVHGSPRPLPSELDYACVAPVFRPFSAPGKPPLGLAGLEGWVRAAGCPVVALGGIDPARAPSCLRAGAAALAGITTFFGDPARVAQDVGALARLVWPAG